MFGQDESHGKVGIGRLLVEHNRMNALASIAAAARHVGVPVTAKHCCTQMHFKNVKRRMELRGTVVNNISVYDDFAHHPTAIATTVAGLRSKVGQARILAVLEPRSNTMKLGVDESRFAKIVWRKQMTGCLATAQHLDWDIEEAITTYCQTKSLVLMDLDALVTAIAIAAAAESGDHILW